MIGTLERSAVRPTTAEDLRWADALPKGTYGSRRRKGPSDFSLFELMLRHPPRVSLMESDALNRTRSKSRLTENIASGSIIASLAV